ncbi:hypothetical protein ABZ069_30035 [Streptomyces microflavus]|uniref:hypothetical protein n=1 Tax=Streptomyces microflavus TaxID=1919 RepID=UPI0033A446DF
MSTETIETVGTTAPPAAEPGSRADLQQAMNATWAVVGIPTADPFFTGQKVWGRPSAYVAEIGYLLLEPVLQIAAEYDVNVTETTTPSGTTYKTVASVHGVDVHVWTTSPTDAPTAVEG